ncbi:MAG: carboxylesterase/lipase family protein [Solirubrobacteraceae bacterium]
MSSAAPIVSTSRGAVRGAVRDGVATFRGIPYAAAPVGDLRFAEPRPHAGWDGVRDATVDGATCPKPVIPAPTGGLLEDPVFPGDEPLNVNVFTPVDALPGGATDGRDRAAEAPAGGPLPRLPVIVWIHGGAFRSGAGSARIYDGSAFARDGVVCVTFNYRLGMDGFGHLPDAPANRGLLDQAALLEWVRDEIGAFGGDPDRVTIFGESSGAMSAICLMTMPRARGLFGRVIAQSGGGQHVQSIVSAARVARTLADRLNVEPTAAGFGDVPLEAFVAAQHQLGTEVSTTDREAWGPLGWDAMPYEPVVDGDVLPVQPLEAARDGAGADIPLLTGTNAEEYRFWLVPLGVLPHVRDEHVALNATALALPPERLDAYLAIDPPGARAEALIADWFFRLPAVRLAEARWGVTVSDVAAAPAPSTTSPPAPGAAGPPPAPTHLYEFTWRSPSFATDAIPDGLGAAHAVEIPFVFGTQDVEEARPLVGPDPPAALAAEMHAVWVAFARGDEPDWPAYDPDRRPVRVFSDGERRVVEDPEAARRRAWDGVR